MLDVIALQRRVAPELTDRMVLRYSILRHVGYAQPIGRRALADRLCQAERAVRREEALLRSAGLVRVAPDGIRLTPDGEDILWDLAEYVRKLAGMSELEEIIKREFGLERAIVVAGDSDLDGVVKRDMARAGASVLREVIRDGDVVAVTGGTTMAAVASEAVEASGKRDVVVAPARGGLGEDVEKQADTVAAALAKKLGGAYKLLNLPDDLGSESAATVLAEPRIRNVLETIRSARVVLHGVGTAEEMARRRNITSAEVKQILGLGAVGEAFGFYFDAGGKVVYVTSSLGLRLSDLALVETVISVGGGASKAEALASVLRNGFSHIAVTDEGAARRMISLMAGASEPDRQNR
ncbi:MAG: sugar-binding domain-containing protein [Clostridia bacterium]|nr:sugar-binding domain-containing protein [Clostridia bacterium]